MFYRGFCVLLLMLPMTAAHAERMYVSDKLVITLRTGPSPRNAIQRSLNSGDAVETLEQTPNGQYTRVRTDQGTEGWVLSQYLTAQPIAADRLVAAQRSLSQARDRTQQLEQRVQSLTAELESTRKSLQEAQGDKTSLTAELADIRDASANALSLRDQNQALKAQLGQRDQRLEQLNSENRQLSSRTRQDWFVIGAAVLLVGIVLGLVLPGLRRRRRSSW
jgi:SH3 domain protein